MKTNESTSSDYISSESDSLDLYLYHNSNDAKFNSPTLDQDKTVDTSIFGRNRFSETTMETCICMICFGEGNNRDLQVVERILKCESCGNSVHVGCYGLTQVRIKTLSHIWVCDMCLSGVDKPSCEVCPNRIGPMKPTTNGKWIHLICALYLKNTIFESNSQATYINIDAVPGHLWGFNSCMLCPDSTEKWLGVSIKCDAGMCVNYSHASCAIQEGLLYQFEELNYLPQPSKNIVDNFYFFCPAHAVAELQAKKCQQWHKIVLQLKEFKPHPTNKTEDFFHLMKNNLHSNTPYEKKERLLQFYPSIRDAFNKKNKAISSKDKENLKSILKLAYVEDNAFFIQDMFLDNWSGDKNCPNTTSTSHHKVLNENLSVCLEKNSSTPNEEYLLRRVKYLEVALKNALKEGNNSESLQNTRFIQQPIESNKTVKTKFDNIFSRPKESFSTRNDTYYINSETPAPPKQLSPTLKNSDPQFESPSQIMRGCYLCFETSRSCNLIQCCNCCNKFHKKCLIIFVKPSESDGMYKCGNCLSSTQDTARHAGRHLKHSKRKSLDVNIPSPKKSAISLKNTQKSSQRKNPSEISPSIAAMQNSDNDNDNKNNNNNNNNNKNNNNNNNNSNNLHRVARSTVATSTTAK